MKCMLIILCFYVPFISLLDFKKDFLSQTLLLDSDIKNINSFDNLTVQQYCNLFSECVRSNTNFSLQFLFCFVFTMIVSLPSSDSLLYRRFPQKLLSRLMQINSNEGISLTGVSPPLHLESNFSLSGIKQPQRRGLNHNYESKHSLVWGDLGSKPKFAAGTHLQLQHNIEVFCSGVNWHTFMDFKGAVPVCRSRGYG